MSSSDAVAKKERRNERVKKVGYSALQLVLSAKEYELVREKLPVDVKKRAITRAEMERLLPEVHGKQFITGSARAALRVFLALKVGTKLIEVVASRLASRRGGAVVRKEPGMSPNTRLSVSVGTLVFLYRLLFRFFTRLRQNIQDPSANAFRQKHPTIFQILSSRLAPSVGPALAGLALAIHPADGRRTLIAVYALVRAFEVAYNGAELSGAFRKKPWWVGSWMLFPLTSAQLLHAFVFDRDCFPEAYGKFILGYSPEYIQLKPVDYPLADWPTTEQIVDGVGTIAKLKFPAFHSPTIVPTAHLPSALAAVAPIIEPAHPIIPSLQCALLHPQNPSCGKTYLSQLLSIFPRVSKIVFILYTLTWLPRYSLLLKDPTKAFSKIGKNSLLTSAFISGAISSSWGAVCFLQKVLPKTFIPESRFALAGFLGGLWSFIDYSSGRSNFLYSTRLSIISLWKVGVKRGWWRGVKNGDVAIFVASLAVMASVHEWRREALGGAGKWIVKGLRGEEGGRRLKDEVKEE